MQVSFAVSQKTLQRLDWPQVLSRLADCARTPRAAARLRPDAGGALPSLFEDTGEGVRARLAETAEARSVLATGDRPPLGGVHETGPALARAGKGGALSARELTGLGGTLAALRETARFLLLRRETAPLLAGRAGEIADLRALEDDIADTFDASGEVADAASPVLARARAEARRLGAEIQSRAARFVSDPDVAPHLSDAYYTVRNDRYVLPVRADARGAVRGIVHDASNTGTTLFVEPEALVERNNRLKGAELEIERETLRVLRALSERAAAAAPEVEAGVEALAGIDLAFARAALCDELDATRPEVRDEGVLRLPQLRHPGLSAGEVVPNDLFLGESYTSLVVSGPNAGGKTVCMKAAALAVLFARAGLHVPAAPPARVDLFDAVLADIGDEQDIREHLSTFSAHMANLARIVTAAGERSFVVLDEIGVGTDPGEGAALAQAVLECLADRGARTIATTHLGLLKEMAEVDGRFANASVEFDAETLAPTYRLRVGLPGASSARAVAARMGVPGAVLSRANELLEREDRQLDKLLAELSASRAALEREQREVRALRAETEAVRAEHRDKLLKLQARRDELYRTMRGDLDRAFRGAHERVAEVIRDLQRGGGARDAARAREKLLALERERKAAEEAAGLAPEPAAALQPIDWRRARPGDAVSLAGGASGVLLALPDRRGRVAVRRGSARVLVPAALVGSAPGGSAPAEPARRPPRVTVVADEAPEEEPADAGRCDLRGLRVDEALDRLLYALDRAARARRPSLVVVHGVGTGALMEAVRRHLAESPYVARFAPGAPDEGGDGVTRAVLRE